MRRRWNLVTLFRTHRVGQRHEGRSVRLLKVFAGGFCENGRRKWAKGFAVFDAPVEDFLHLRTARVGDNAAIAKRARTPFGAALKPAEDFSIRDDRGGTLRQLFFVQFGDRIAVACQAIRLDRPPDFFARIARPPVSVVHYKRARLAENLMPNIKCRADRQSRVSGRRLHINLFERCGFKDLSIRHAIESHAARETHGFEPGSLAEFFEHA